MSIEQSKINHAHSLETLEMLNQYQDYMDNLENVTDMGCGYGYDSAWFAQLLSDSGVHRNIKVNAVDIQLDHIYTSRHDNINYIEKDFGATGIEQNSQDLIWAHNSLQYSLAPMYTLYHWWQILKNEGMLLVTVPYNFSINTHRDILKVETMYSNGCYYNWTMGSLIMHLVATGFDCRNSHFKIDRKNGYLYASVYKLPNLPNPTMNWYEMCDRKLLPLSIEQSVMGNGNFHETDIVVEWIDRTQYMLSV
jgi:SAM-dependent methyltransferase